MKTPKHLLVVSFDAISKKDFEAIKNLPNFSKFLETASFSKDVKSINPTLTYPCHTSIITGTYPIKHGISMNTKIQPNRLDSPDWYWYRKDIKVDTLYDIARKKGLTVSAQLWPVTAGAKINYHFPEIFSNRGWKPQLFVSLWNGSFKYQIELVKKYGHLLDGHEQPNLDNFVQKGLLHTIKKYKPNLMLVHFTDTDSTRHYFGYDSQQAEDSLKRHDKRLGEIIQTLKDENIYEDTTIILLGDHGHIPTDKVLSINKKFELEGLLTSKNGKIISHKVITKSTDGSAYIYVKDASIKDRVRYILEQLQETTGAINKIYEKEDIIHLKMQTEADFMVDANDGFYFNDRLEKQVVTNIEMENGRVKKGYLLSSHGYLNNHKDYETLFMISGKGIKKGFEIGDMSLVDEAPTMAKILDLKMQNVDGRILSEIFE